MEGQDKFILGVNNSVSGNRWQLRRHDNRLALAIAQQFSLDQSVANALVGRDIDLDKVEGFLNPTIRSSCPNPMGLRNMDKAAALLSAAIAKNKAIGILGDYDVDGATSVALMVHYMDQFDIKTHVHIPDRFTEGYGPNQMAMDKLVTAGAELIVCLDCGTSSAEILEATEKDHQVPVIVIDHHQPSEWVPNIAALVNPNQNFDDSAQGHLAACGVTYLTLIGLNSHLKKNPGLNKDNRPLPDLLRMLDLVALGTVADLVPLQGFNRAIVKQGIEVMRMRGNFGIKALADMAGIDHPITASDIGFQLGPRINAGSRIGDSTRGYRLLTTADPYQAQQLAADLDQDNQHRKELELECVIEAQKQAALQEDKKIIHVYGDGWPEGVVGIVASRLVEEYHKPALVTTLFDGNDGLRMGKGSARSIKGFDIGQALIEAEIKGLIIKGGGHQMAGGYSLKFEKIEPLNEFLYEKSLSIVEADWVYAQTLLADGVIPCASVHADLAHRLEQLAPFGMGNPEPRYVLSNAQIVDARIVGGAHVSLRLRANSSQIKAIAFKVVEKPLGDLLLSKGKNVHLLGKIKLDRWMGQEKVSVHIEDGIEAVG